MAKLTSLFLLSLLIAQPVWAGASRYWDTSDWDIEVDDSASLDISGGITLAAWVYPNSDAAALDIIMSKGNAAGDDANYQLDIRDQSGTTYEFWFIWNTGGYGLITSDARVVNEDEWQHLAATYDGSGDGVLYYNGTETASATSASSALTPNIRPFEVGMRSTDKNAWSGNLAHIQVWNRVLSADEIATVYKHPQSVTDGLAIYLPLTGDDSVEEDLSGNGNDGTVQGPTESFDGPALTGAIW